MKMMLMMKKKTEPKPKGKNKYIVCLFLSFQEVNSSSSTIRFILFDMIFLFSLIRCVFKGNVCNS